MNQLGFKKFVMSPLLFPCVLSFVGRSCSSSLYAITVLGQYFNFTVYSCSNPEISSLHYSFVTVVMLLRLTWDRKYSFLKRLVVFFLIVVLLHQRSLALFLLCTNSLCKFPSMFLVHIYLLLKFIKSIR